MGVIDREQEYLEHVIESQCDPNSQASRTIARLRIGLVRVSFMLQRCADSLDKDIMLDPGHSVANSLLDTREWVNTLIRDTATQDKGEDNVREDIPDCTRSDT